MIVLIDKVIMGPSNVTILLLLCYSSFMLMYVLILFYFNNISTYINIKLNSVT
jgi:hypothetical protein